MRPPSPNQLRFVFVLALVAAVTVGCFRSGSDEPFDATPVARAIPTLTPTHTDVPPTPTETPEPTPEAEDEFDEFDAFDEADDENGFDFGAPPTEDPFEVFDPEGTAIALLEQIDDPTPELDPLILEATQAIIRQTQIFLDQTATQQAVFEVPTETFTPDFFVTATPDFIEQPTDIFPPLSGADCVHEVVAGQNLFRLSLLYGVPIRNIATASGVTNPDFIRVGQRLVIPGCGTTGVRPPATSVAPDGSFGAGGTGGFTTAGNIRHTVEQGETLFQISLRYGVPMASIAAANGITNFNYIRFNQVLVIP